MPEQEKESALTLRPIRPDDEPFLARLYASTRQEELSQVDWDEPQKAAFLAQQFAAQHRFYQEQFPAAEFDLILRGEEPIGRLYVDRREDELRLIDIALIPKERSNGLGTQLLTNLLAEARVEEKPVRIHVEKFNPALRLYYRLGFRNLEDQGVYFLLEWSAPG